MSSHLNLEYNCYQKYCHNFFCLYFIHGCLGFLWIYFGHFFLIFFSQLFIHIIDTMSFAVLCLLMFYFFIYYYIFIFFGFSSFLHISFFNILCVWFCLEHPLKNKMIHFNYCLCFFNIGHEKIINDTTSFFIKYVLVHFNENCHQLSFSELSFFIIRYDSTFVPLSQLNLPYNNNSCRL